jgi:hypothetical protein
LLALLEQFGYMIRFYNDTKKYKKYFDRAQYCLLYYNVKYGGKTKKRKTKRIKSKKNIRRKYR